MPPIRQRKSDKPGFKIKEIAMNYGTYIAVGSALFTFGYKTFAEPLVEDTARKVAIQVADSVVSSERKWSDSTSKQMYSHLKIIHNYMKLQDKKLFEAGQIWF